MRTRFAASGISVFILLSSSAMATPVTSADLSGKKFCWDGGGTENYYADGKYVSSVDGTGTWVVVKDGVEIKTNQITGLAEMQKLRDGTFTSTWIVDGKPKTWTGRVCQ
jgi:uncharacterized protein with FMN-binding domain